MTGRFTMLALTGYFLYCLGDYVAQVFNAAALVLR